VQRLFYHLNSITHNKTRLASGDFCVAHMAKQLKWCGI
jgi:hypothetical protein